MTGEAPHGTPGRYARCRLEPGGPCDPCRWARALYTELVRWENPAYRDRGRRAKYRRERALAILGRRHADELEAIMRALVDDDLRAGAALAPV